MIDHGAYRRAIRHALLNLSVCTTGSLNTLTATALGFKRSDAGSFLSDGFYPGMEVKAAGFSAANNEPKVVTDVTAAFLTVDGGCVVQGAGTSRSIACGLPSQRAWTNRKLATNGEDNPEGDPEPLRPFVTEQYIPGAPSQKKTFTSSGEHELLPLYQAQFHIAENFGADAADAYAKAMIALFSPNTSIALSDGSMSVRSDTGPYPGQLLPSRPGFAAQPVTIALRVRATTPINTL